jgi:hypothetical protein
MPAGLDETEARERALQSGNVKRSIGSRRVQRAVHVPDRLINLVTE